VPTSSPYHTRQIAAFDVMSQVVLSELIGEGFFRGGDANLRGEIPKMGRDEGLATRSLGEIGTSLVVSRSEQRGFVEVGQAVVGGGVGAGAVQGPAQVDHAFGGVFVEDREAIEVYEEQAALGGIFQQ
jgi:hypothetical protein